MSLRTFNRSPSKWPPCRRSIPLPGSFTSLYLHFPLSLWHSRKRVHEERESVLKGPEHRDRPAGRPDDAGVAKEVLDRNSRTQQKGSSKDGGRSSRAEQREAWEPDGAQEWSGPLHQGPWHCPCCRKIWDLYIIIFFSFVVSLCRCLLSCLGYLWSVKWKLCAEYLRWKLALAHGLDG